MDFKEEYITIVKEYDPLIEEYNQLSKDYAKKRDCKQSEKYSNLQTLAEKYARYKIGQLFTENNFVWKIVRLQPSSNLKEEIYIGYILRMVGRTGKEVENIHSKPVSEIELDQMKSVNTVKEVNIIPQTIIIKEIKCVKESNKTDNQNLYLIKDKSNRLFTFNYDKINDLTKVTKIQRTKHSIRYQLYEKNIWNNKSRSRWTAYNLKQITKDDIPDLMAELI